MKTKKRWIYTITDIWRSVLIKENENLSKCK